MNTPYELTKDLTIKLLYSKNATHGIDGSQHLVTLYQNFISKMIREVPEVEEYIHTYIEASE